MFAASQKARFRRGTTRHKAPGSLCGPIFTFDVVLVSLPQDVIKTNDASI